jgi:Xaa-Pro aminopeptidase
MKTSKPNNPFEAPKAIEHDFERRRGRLRRKLKSLNIDAMLVTSFVNVTYLTGFTGDSSYLLLDRDGECLLSDSRYDVQIADECPQLDVISRRAPTPMTEILGKAVRTRKIGTLGIEADLMTVTTHEELSSALTGVELAGTSGVVGELRQIKDRSEVDAIRNSLRIAERAFAVIRASLRPDQTEREIAFALEHQIRLFGGDGCSFEPIVAAGHRAALPHAQPQDRRIGDDDLLLIDWGAISRGYMSDLTRVLVTGKMSPKLERVYGVVLKAQRRAIEAIRPGVTLGKVDSAARSIIQKAGFGPKFGHGLGHGFGLEIHENPRMAPNQPQELKAGMVVTVEPGIYLPNWGGVRIEDDILVTKDGHEVLSNVPKELDECFV